MKRKERKILFRIVNAISSVVFLISFVYILFWGISVAAISGATLAVCCIVGPAAMGGATALDVMIAVLEALLHGFTDAILGIFEAIGNIFSST